LDDCQLTLSLSSSFHTGSLCQLDVCGRAPLNNKIVGGEDATAGAWPWQVSIHLSGSSHNCGGTLITKDWVLSAAHCFQDFVLSRVVMYFGRLSQSGSNPNEMSRRASQVINHPNYDSRSNDNDIALIQLSSSVTFSDYIKPVCLAAAASVFGGGTESWVTGWGKLQSGGTQLPDTLQEVMIPVVSNSACANAYKGMYTITSNMVCAGLLNQGGKDSCQNSHVGLNRRNQQPDGHRGLTKPQQSRVRDPSLPGGPQKGPGLTGLVSTNQAALREIQHHSAIISTS
ncbi:hypothetical protein cypCar_00015994, partial [Cyprinus carpio]